MSRRLRQLCGLLLLTLAAIAIHGYHLGTDDGAIYAPGIKKFADPQLYPNGSEFFASHAHLSLLPSIVGGAARLTHIPADWAILLCQFVGVFLLLVAASRLAGICFRTERARWGAVILLALTLSVPVAGTALVIMDPYVTARTLSTPLILLALTAQLQNKWKATLFWLALSLAVHPQMGIYAVLLSVSIACARTWNRAPANIRLLARAACWVGLPWPFDPPTGVARDVLLTRSYFFVTNWTWYEWCGIIAPLLLLYLLAKRKPRALTTTCGQLCFALLPYGGLAIAASVCICFVPALQNFARVQPMRCFHLLYLVMFALIGGLLAEYLLRRSAVRWAALVVPLATGMYLLARGSYSHSRHVELPGGNPENKWVSAFLWVRDNTPKDAVFALDPDYMGDPDNDQHGFRAIAERSALADRLKDSGPASLFPGLAQEWKREVDAEQRAVETGSPGLKDLAQIYRVSWVISGPKHLRGLTCPYQNSEVAVCKVGDR